MSAKIIPIKHKDGTHLYEVSDEKPQQGEWGIGYAVGIEIDGEITGNGFFKFFNNGSCKSKLSSLCKGSKKIISTTDNLKIECPNKTIENGCCNKPDFCKVSLFVPKLSKETLNNFFN